MSMEAGAAHVRYGGTGRWESMSRLAISAIAACLFPPQWGQITLIRQSFSWKGAAMLSVRVGLSLINYRSQGICHELSQANIHIVSQVMYHAPWTTVCSVTGACCDAPVGSVRVLVFWPNLVIVVVGPNAKCWEMRMNMSLPSSQPEPWQGPHSHPWVPWQRGFEPLLFLGWCLWEAWNEIRFCHL